MSRKDGEFSKLMKSFTDEAHAESGGESSDKEKRKPPAANQEGQQGESAAHSGGKDRQAGEREKCSAAKERKGERESGGRVGASRSGRDVRAPKKPETRGKKGTLMTEEERNHGGVAFSVYLSYLRNGGGYSRFALIVFCFLLVQGLLLLTSLWIAMWTDSVQESGLRGKATAPGWGRQTGRDGNNQSSVGGEKRERDTGGESEGSFGYYLGGYALIVAGSAVCTFIRS